MTRLERAGINSLGDGLDGHVLVDVLIELADGESEGAEDKISFVELDLIAKKGGSKGVFKLVAKLL